MKKLLLFLFALIAFGAAEAQTLAGGSLTELPKGELKTYDRSGYSYYVSNDYVRRGAQTGTIDIVYGADNTVYLLDPLAKAITGAWVKGTLSADGKTITLPLGQAIAHDDTQNDNVVLAMMEFDEDEEDFYEDTSVSSVTYKVSADGTIQLDGTSKYKVLAAMWEKSRAWAEYADYYSKYTEKTEDDVAVTPPAGLTTDTYRLSATSYVSGKAVAYSIELGFDGNDAYIKGIFNDTPDSWIKGTKSGNTVTFPTGQYLAPTHTGTTNYYMIATNHQNTSEIQDLRLTFDEATGKYTTDQYVVLNTAKKTVYLVDALDNVVIEKLKTDGHYDVPYETTFLGGLSEFTVIDANNDGHTWMSNRMSNTAAYEWCAGNAGDDWLILPAIRLEQGHQYVFTANARSFAGMEERFEVKAGSSNTAEAMTQTVIAPTTVATEEFADFTGKFTCPADGDYFFGIHAISDADNNGLYLNSVKVVDVETLGISGIATDGKAAADIYSIGGQLVRKGAASTDGLDKGLYIMGHRKVVVK